MLILLPVSGLWLFPSDRSTLNPQPRTRSHLRSQIGSETKIMKTNCVYENLKKFIIATIHLTITKSYLFVEFWKSWGPLRNILFSYPSNYLIDCGLWSINESALESSTRPRLEQPTRRRGRIIEVTLSNKIESIFLKIGMNYLSIKKSQKTLKCSLGTKGTL